MVKTILIISGVLVAFHILTTIIILVVGEGGLRLRESTRNFAKEAGWKRVLDPRSFMHGYIYFRWLKYYVWLGLKVTHNIPVIGPLIIDKTIRPGYHAKTLTFDQAKAMVTINEEIPLQDLGEHILPYPVARDFLIGKSTEFAVMECACRASRENSCKPTQVCIITGKPFVDFVLEHSPDITRRITREEALQLIKEEHERGHVQSAWFKDASIDRIWAICNCCRCCCVGVDLMNNFGLKFMCSSGYIPVFDAEKCKKCWKCVKKCPFEALKIEDDKIVLDWDKCMGCGVCVDMCPEQAISFVRDEKKGAPLDVTRMVG